MKILAPHHLLIYNKNVLRFNPNSMSHVKVNRQLEKRLAEVAKQTNRPQEEIVEEAVNHFLAENERWETLRQRQKDAEQENFATPEELQAIETKLSEWKHAG